ncbi:MAG: hypothetical protein VKL41_16640 [Snowella sp.]|nr:hypothetical protein [Snowella sp.]
MNRRFNQCAWCVPQKSIGGAVGAILGNAPYKIGDHIFKVRSLSRLHSRSNDRVHWAVEVKDFRIEYLR